MTDHAPKGKRGPRAIDWSTHGECTKCRRLHRLTENGSIWHHYNGARNSGTCPGAGLLAVARTVAQRAEESR